MRDQWTIMSAYARLAFNSKTGGLSAFAEEMERLPGIKKKAGLWEIPFNALEVVEDLRKEHNVMVEAAAWGRPQRDPIGWGAIVADLAAGEEVHSWVLDGFLTPYQQEALAFGWTLPGVHYWHPTGCLTGDTKLIVNRAGKSFEITLKDLVEKFNGAESGRWGKGYRWDPEIDTYVQCSIDGHVRLNKLHAAFYTGEKEVFSVVVRDPLGEHRWETLTITATKDHRFLTPDGFKRLEDLSVGDKVIVRGAPGKKQKKPKADYKQVGVRYHPHAVVVESERSDAWCDKRRYRRGYVERSYRVPEHRLVAEAKLNDMNLSDWVKICRSSSSLFVSYDEVDRMLGYPGRVKAGILLGAPVFTTLDPRTHAVHHIDGNHRNNDPDNLEVLTHEEHWRKHGREELWQNVVAGTEEAEIQLIQPVGVDQTYDLTMESPHNNYVADGFVVHNSGKTLTGMLCALSVEGPVIVVTRAASRLQFGREIERFLNVRAYVLRPAAQLAGPVRVNGESWNEFRSRHKGRGFSTKQLGQMWKDHQQAHGVDRSKTLTDYLAEIDHRPFIVVGWEALSDNVDTLCGLGPGAVIFDESHRGKNSKRWEVVHLPDLPEEADEMRKQHRQDTAEARKNGGFIKDTPEGRKMFLPVENTASAAARLARAAEKRICTTATPIKDRVRDLWAQLDLGEPNAWGNATAWKKRHCDMKPGIYGGMDDRGSSNLDELNTRLRKVAHILKYEETHRHLPTKRRQSLYVAPEDQCRTSSGFAREIREAQKRGPSHVLEVRLAQAASKKRKAVMGVIEDHVGSKQKVVVFTGRKRDCDALGETVRKLPLVKKDSVQVWSAHGGQSTDVRQQIIDEYMAHPGPCVLVGTGHAFGESLNIHDTDAALFVMLPYTPGQLRQWEGRFTRLGQKRPVVIYYVIAEDSVDEHVAHILIDKLPAVEDVAQDTELAAARGILSGIDENETDEEFVASVLAELDWE